MKLRTLLFGIFLGLVPATVAAEPAIPLRGDLGVLTDFRPNAAAWLSDDRILLADLRYNNLQIFDLQGRRFRLFEAPSIKAPAQYVGLAKISDDEFLALGSHYHEQNHPRYRTQRSTMQRIHLDGEDLQQPEHNMSPVESLRRTRMWGASPVRQLEFCGIAVDHERNLAWFGLAKPDSEQKTLTLLTCPLDKLLAEDPNLEFSEVDTGFALPDDGPCGLPSYLADIALLDDGSLMFLVTADDMEGKRFCSNSLWHWSPETRETTLVRDNLAMENRAKGMAVRSVGDGTYKIALVCDNDTEVTGIPATLVVLEEPVGLSSAPPEATPLNLESYTGVGAGSPAFR
jgi:hypothetical protein